MTIRTYCCLALIAVLTTGCNTSSTTTTTDGPIAAGPDGPNIIRTHAPKELQDPIDFSERSVVRGEVVPTIIDTANFQKQIYRTEPFQGVQQSSSIFRPVKKGKPGLVIGPANDLQPGALTNEARIAPGQLFPGTPNHSP